MTTDAGNLYETERVTQQIMACMDTVLQGDYTWNTCAGVEHLLRARLAQTVPLETPGWLPFQNGALCLETMTLHPHSPERPFTWQLPHAYDPQATCPQTQAWLHETVGGAHDQVQVLRAYAKAVVTRRVDLQRYLETLGPGGTGKGTYTRLLMALVGCENTVATELKHLEANRFELSQLRGKVLMVITDAERYSGPVNALKAITGQDFVRMEEKFKAQRTEVAPVMVVVAANEPVQSADYTSGLVRRRLAMTFRHRPAVPRDLLSWHAGAWQWGTRARNPRRPQLGAGPPRCADGGAAPADDHPGPQPPGHLGAEPGRHQPARRVGQPGADPRCPHGCPGEPPGGRECRARPQAGPEQWL